MCNGTLFVTIQTIRHLFCQLSSLNKHFLRTIQSDRMTAIEIDKQTVKEIGLERLYCRDTTIIRKDFKDGTIDRQTLHDVLYLESTGAEAHDIEQRKLAKEKRLAECF